MGSRIVYIEPPLLLKYGKNYTVVHFVNEENERLGFAKAIPLSQRCIYDRTLPVWDLIRKISEEAIAAREVKG